LSASILEQLSRPLRARASITLPERLACSRDLWQRRLIEVQHGGAAPIAPTEWRRIWSAYRGRRASGA